MSLPSGQSAPEHWGASASYSGAASPASSFMSTDETDAAFALTALANAAAAMPQVSSPPNGKTTGMALAATAAVTPSPPTVPIPTRLPHVSSQHRVDEMAAALTWAKTQTYIPDEEEESIAKPAAEAAAALTTASKKSGGKKAPKKAVKGVSTKAKAALAKSKPKSKKTGSNPKAPGDTVPLSLPSDKKHLSGSACILRQQIEVFSATVEDTMARGARHRPPVGAVGIRCIHCLHLPHSRRARGAVTFPSCIRLLYQGVRNFQR